MPAHKQYEVPRPEHITLSREEYDRWVKEFEQKYGDVLERLTGEEAERMKQKKMMWRGMAGESIENLIGDSSPIRLESEWPNATIDPDRAISYYEEQSDFPANTALGFFPGEGRMRVTPAKSKMTAEDVPEGALEYQEGNFILSGDISPKDARLLLLRVHGDQPGEVGEEQLYKIHYEKLQEGKQKAA